MFNDLVQPQEPVVMGPCFRKDDELLISSLRANESRERAPDDGLREAIQLCRARKKEAGLLRR
jgi:hypothetical protein